MCGICGVLNFDRDQTPSDMKIQKMKETLIHRGPDSGGTFIHNNVALGHRRLSIIDLTTGDQPMFNEDRSIVLVFNGEIYNYLELKSDLRRRGYSFHTTSDSEVIIRAYEEWGTDCLNFFNGAWAIAIWDERKQCLFLSRDRMGEKPLFYSVFDNTLVFASEIKALFAYGVPKEVNHDVTELYFGLINIPAPYTFYKNIMQIEPAQYLIINEGKVSKTYFWRLPEIDEENMLKDKNRVYSEFEFLLRDAVKIRMRSDVPFGAFLSGGLDSSSIVAIMSGLTSFPVNTFTIGYDKSDYDESKLASLVADKYRTKHFRGTVAPEQFETALDKVLYHYDGPFGDSSAIPTGQVSKFASKNVKMVLTGDGGDEVLSGYVSYQGIKLTQRYNKLPTLIQKELPDIFDFISSLLKGRSRFRFDKFAKASRQANLDFNIRMLEKIPMTSLRSVRELIPQSQSMIKLEDYLSNLMSSCTYKDEFYRLMFLDFKYTLPDDMLVKVDRMSMSESIEARIPFLDHRLVEFMAHVDKDVKMQGYERKSILRRTIGKELPPELLKVGKKGFGIPLFDWFRLPEFHKPLQTLINSNNGLNGKTIIKIIDENNMRIRNNGNFIWMIFLYDRWLNNSR